VTYEVSVGTAAAACILTFIMTAAAIKADNPWLFLLSLSIVGFLGLLTEKIEHWD
jgi:hypothetical protein